MVSNPNTRYMVVDKAVANEINAIGKELGLTTFQVTNQRLRFALSLNELKTCG
jgi:hypothetical protein